MNSRPWSAAPRSTTWCRARWSASAPARRSTTSSTRWRRCKAPHRRRGVELRQAAPSGCARTASACSTATRSSDSRSTSTAPTRSTARGHMIKGGGAALTREKIVADLAEALRLHRRRIQAGRRAGPLSAAGGGDPDGGGAGRAPLRRAAAARRALRDGVRDRQRPADPRRARPAHRRPAGDGDRGQPVARRRDGGHLRAPQGQRCACSARAQGVQTLRY